MKKNRPAGSSRGGPRRSVDRDGVVRVELRRGGPPLVTIALGLAGASLVAFLLWQRHQAEPAPPASNPALAASSRALSASSRSAVAATARARSKDSPTLRVAARSPDTAAPSNAHVVGAGAPVAPSLPGPDEPSGDSPEEGVIAPPAAPVDGSEGAAQPKTGIAVFPAPGTKRIKTGLKVPEDFPLPPGYVRHYQATDKGLMLEPILLYHPDYELVDARGQVIPLPPGRVVPPEMAPEGLPLDTLEVPADAYADRDEHGPATNADPGQTGVDEEKPADDKP